MKFREEIAKLITTGALAFEGGSSKKLKKSHKKWAKQARKVLKRLKKTHLAFLVEDYDGALHIVLAG